MKRIFAMFLASLLCLGLFGCGAKKDKEENAIGTESGSDTEQTSEGFADDNDMSGEEDSGLEMTPSKGYFLEYREEDEDYTAPEGIVSMHAESIGEYGPLWLTVTITNNTDEDYIFGEEYALQKLTGDSYEDMEPVKEYGWEDLGHILGAGESTVEHYDLTVFGDVDTFEEGSYRLVKTDLECEFGVIIEWTE